jgi:hypothetical protein
VRSDLFLIKGGRARHQWLAPVILAIQKAEIRRIAVQSQPQANSTEILSQKKKSIQKKGRWRGSSGRASD